MWVSVRSDSLPERGEFELPVPICERSDDSTRLTFATSRPNCKALSPCSAFLVRIRVAGERRGQTGLRFYWIAVATSVAMLFTAHGEGLLRKLPPYKLTWRLSLGDPDNSPVRHAGDGRRRQKPRLLTAFGAFNRHRPEYG